VRRLICLSLPGNSGSLEKSGVNFSQQSIVASLEELSSPAHAYRSVEVLYSEEVIKIQQRSEKRNKPVDSLASNQPILLLPLA
jgi:hypothetical protein